MDVEEVAGHDPDAIAKYWVDPAIGSRPSWRAARVRGEAAGRIPQDVPAIAGALYDLFMEYGANLVEINPLVLTKDGRVIASDAKVDSTTTRSGNIPTSRHGTKTTSRPTTKIEAALAIGLGCSTTRKLWMATIGVIANGAGLGMGTMDAIRNAGGRLPTSSTSAAARKPSS